MTLKSSATDHRSLTWVKSSYSGTSSGNDCVEAAASSVAVHVRDSKRAHGPRVAFAPTAWSGFIAHTCAN